MTLVSLKCPLSRLDLQWQNKDAMTAIVNNGGSKAGSTNFIQEHLAGLREYLPGDSHYLAPNEDLETFLSKIDFSKPKIIRACHPYDFCGLVDVIDTHKNVDGRDQTREKILAIFQQAQSQELKSWVNYDIGDNQFDGQVGILVQDYIGPICGSIIEYPQKPGFYRISTENTSTPANQNYAKDLVCDIKGNFIDPLRSRVDQDQPYENPWSISLDNEFHQRVPEVIRLYRTIKDSGMIPDSHSYQMEFGIEPQSQGLKFYQARIFRPFTNIEQITSGASPYLAFGDCPDSDLILPIRYLSREAASSNDPTAFYFSNSSVDNRNLHRKPTSLDIQPENMQAYLVPINEGLKLLEHGHFRWAQRAPRISIAYRFPQSSEELRELMNGSASYYLNIPENGAMW
jgi:hypothetical protein